MIKRIAFIAFLMATAGELVAQLRGVAWLHHWCKPMLMVLLGIYYYASTSRDTRSVAVLVALFFSFLGDSFLMYEAENPLYFMMGLGAFLLAHIVYVVAYARHQFDATTDSLAGVHRVRMAFPIVLAGTGLVIVLYPALGALQIPVVVYAVLLVVMVLKALFRYKRTNAISFQFVFMGALLFMVSDSLLAINKFLQPIPYAGVWIMATYIGAQVLIVKGVVRHYN